MLDEKDMIIIDALRKNARTKICELAEKLGISNTAVKKRIEKLEREGVIVGYRALVNEQMLGNKKVLIIMHVGVEKVSDLIQTLLKNKELCDSVYYKFGGNYYMFYLLTDKENAKELRDKVSSFSKYICPLTVLDKLV